MRRAGRAAAWAVAVVALLLAGLASYDRAAPRPSPWLEQLGLEARYETVDGHRLRYVRAGHGPAVVLVHGFGSSLYAWKDVIPGLARDHEVVALDLPGFGLSDQPADLSVDALPRAVLGLMDRLSIARAALVGNSLGGGVCAMAAGAHPDRVSALVLVDAAGYNLGPSERPAIVRLTMGPAGVARVLAARQAARRRERAAAGVPRPEPRHAGAGRRVPRRARRGRAPSPRSARSASRCRTAARSCRTRSRA